MGRAEPARQGQINCIASIDVTKDDIADVVVGRDDGRVQVYSFDMAPTPGLQFERALNESIPRSTAASSPRRRTTRSCCARTRAR